MKKYYVYELINLMGTIEYVGRTTRKNSRFIEHIKHKPTSSGKGMFYGRQDLIINFVKEFDNSKDASRYECELKTQYGLVCTENLNARNNGIKSASKVHNGVVVYKEDTNELVGEFISLNQMRKTLNLNLGASSLVANGLLKSTKGYIIRYNP